MGHVSLVSNMGMLQETAQMVNPINDPLITKEEVDIKEGVALERNSLARKETESACYFPMIENSCLIITSKFCLKKEIKKLLCSLKM